MKVPRIALVVALIAALTVSFAPGAAGVTWPAGSYQVDLTIERIGGADRYETAVLIASDSFPGWADIDHVIVASGEDRALSDPLAAGSLCWAYDAPLLLVKGDDVPAQVAAALEAIRSSNTTVTVTVVGGPVAVSADAVAEIESIMGTGTVEQPWTTGDRYALAAGIAGRAASVAAETSRTIPARALVANGTDGAGFVDALAASAISARTGIPVLLVEKYSVPAATASALAAGAPGSVIVVGGPAVISAETYTAAGATTRWSGSDRYGTAAVVAAGGRNRGWLTGSVAGVASTVPDALAGAVNIGREGGPLLYVPRSTLGWPAADYLHRNRALVSAARIFGGTGAVPLAIGKELMGGPSVPRVLTPTAGSRLARRAQLVVSTGVNTVELEVYSGTTLVAERQAGGYTNVDFGTIATPAEGTQWRIVARNAEGEESMVAQSHPRYSYPAPTSIVIDKSDFRLYWFKDDVFIKSYAIAIGKSSTPTPAAIWRIDSKYYTDPNGVYGPRKLRLYRKVGSRYVYTNYGIHGTNQPWVIGTKASHGCIRLHNTQILDLFPRVPLGTIVQTRE